MKRKKLKRYYNRDAERFLEKAKLKREQEREIEEMNKSFDVDVSEFEYALGSEK